MESLGLTISASKCTQSENGYAEFAKRYFTPNGEVTGFPVDILEDMQVREEQVLEFVRILRARGYTDEQIVPGMSALIKNWSSRNLIAHLLSVPEEISGVPPLHLHEALGITADHQFD